VVYIVWGSTYLAIEYAIRSMPPLLAMGSRFLAAGLLMGAVLAIKFGPGYLKVTKRQIPFLALLGSLLLGLGLGMVTLAQFNDVLQQLRVQMKLLHTAPLTTSGSAVRRLDSPVQCVSTSS